MMKLQCNPKKADPQFTINGKKIFELMQDRETDSCDLLIREVVQNSSDAITQYGNKKGKIFFDVGKFETEPLLSCLDDDNYHFGRKFQIKKEIESTSYYLSIRDCDTFGLCGSFHQTDYKRNNLFNLVYSVLEDNKRNDDGIGGSHGIGKTVYYRFGKQLVFYYSRAKEESGEIVSKLAGVYLEDNEDSPSSSIFDSNYSGIVCFGQDETYNGFDLSGPIYDESEIEEFLSIFGIKPFSDNRTGTVIIIPFIKPADFGFQDDYDLEYLLDNKLWLICQRWYFPRIDNEKFRGSYLEIYINNKKQELTPFFIKMQNLYNGDDECQKIELKPKNSYGILEDYGSFNYKVFNNAELNVLTPPDNYPSPYELLDLDESDRGPIFFYARTPGMVINYKYNDELKINPSNLNDDEYLIGCYVVNNDCRDSTNRSLDSYFKKSERDNHKQWHDLKDDKFSGNMPFNEIKKQITKKLKEIFEIKHLIDPKETTNTRLQKKLGSLLVAPTGYGLRKKVTEKKKRKKHVEKCDLEFCGFTTSMSYPTYEVAINFKPKEICSLKFMIKTEMKNFTVDEWVANKFEVPFKAVSLEVAEIGINGGDVYHPNNEYAFDSNQFNVSVFGYGECVRFDLINVESNTSKLLVRNLTNKGLALIFRLRIEPLSQDYQFTINEEFLEG